MPNDAREHLPTGLGQEPPRPKGGFFRSIGVGVITGAADDDPSAIGTYASAGAKFGLSFLWIAPVVLPMMYVVVYLSAKLGQVYGKGLFAAIRHRFPRWILYPAMIGAFIGNVIEAAADVGGIGAALNLLIPIPIPLIVIGAAAVIFALQLFGYIAAAVLAKPDPLDVLKSTFVPHVQFSAEFLSIIVACIGTSLSAYIYTWQSNQEVEEQIARGRWRWFQRRGATEKQLQRTKRDVFIGMLFSNVILYFIILSTATTLHSAGETNIESAAQAAAALEPLAGSWASVLFAAGVVGVGFLAVPIMTTGAAYDLVQGFGARGSLNAKPTEAKLFYGTIAVVTVLAVAMNFLGFNPMKALVWSGIVQGFSVPPLLVLMLIMTNDREMMGDRKNGPLTNFLGWTTTAVTLLAAAFLVLTSFM
jgi:Mn2+/Fe2+ NRAMP family transporter